MQYSYEPYSVSKLNTNLKTWNFDQSSRLTNLLQILFYMYHKDSKISTIDMIKLSLILPLSLLLSSTKIQVKMNMYICSSPLNSPRLAFSFLSFFISFFPLLLSRDIFSFMILIEFCTLSTPLVSLLPSIASDPKQTI